MKIGWLVVALALPTLVIGAFCEPNSTTPMNGDSPTPETATMQTRADELVGIFEQVEPIVRDLRQLEVETATVAYELLSRDEIIAYVDGIFADSEMESPEDFAAANTFYKLLGIIRGDDSIADVLSAQYGEAALGFYSPDDGRVRVLNDATQPLHANTVTTYAHEYVHYLQDRNFGLSETRGESLTTDAYNAITALIEGDASFVDTLFAQGHPELLDGLADGFDLAAQAAILEQTMQYPYLTIVDLVFPYQFGPIFVSNVVGFENDFAKLDLVWRDPPQSTEQILTPFNKYLAEDGSILPLARRDVPIEIDDTLFKRHSAWEADEAGSDTLGALALSAWLENTFATGGFTYTRLQAQNLVNSVFGWGGDSLRLLERTDGTVGLQWLIAWDAPATDADELRQGLSFITGLNSALVSETPCRLANQGIDTLVYDDNVLVHTIFEHPTLGVMNSIAVSNSCATALELLTTTTTN